MEKEMNHIDMISYDKMEFVFILSHYDINLSGLCKHNNKLCEFKLRDYDDPDDDLKCYIYKLSFKEKIKWLYKKTIFEWCIGYHWTYPYRKNGYKLRRPRWFWQIVHNLYYHKTIKR